MSFTIGVVGTGYVGLVSGTSFAATGNDVYCIDIDEEKINKLNQGISPIYEPGLEHMLQRDIRDGRLHFSTRLEDAVERCSIIFLCLPTPPNEDGSADLQHVLKVAGDIAGIVSDKNIARRIILVNKSTVPVGTAEKVRRIIDQIAPGHKIDVVSNPEFLREGFAVEDAMKPERVVIGTSSEYVEKTMRDLYQPFLRSGNPIFVMDEKSAEVTKYAANSFLATKISFMNDLSEYCEAVGADIEKIRMGIGSDSRIGKRFLFAGIGYGGSCFPKDVRALKFSAENMGTPLKIISAAEEVNKRQIIRFCDRILSRFGNSLKGKKITIWGLSFKPNTDDTRDAPSFVIIDYLLRHRAKVSAFDQEAMSNTKVRFGESIEYSRDMYSALLDSDALIIATEWNVFRNPDFAKVKELMARPLMFDGRNLFEPDDMEEIGVEYHCIGRRSANHDN